jgi:hypothetical protein
VEDLVDGADSAIAAAGKTGGDRAVSAGRLAQDMRDEESAAEAMSAKAAPDEGDDWDLDV